jgi:hypothetical protein
MPFDDKVGLFSNGGELVRGETDIDIDDTMALGAGQMVMVFASTTDTVVMRSVRELDAVE